MKKLLVAALALTVSVSSFAQFGVVGGLTSTSSTLKGAYADLKSKNINQFHVGILFKIPVGKFFAIQPEILYNVKGAILQNDLSSIDLKTGYLEVPIQLQGGVSLGSVARIYGIVEPFVGYALSNQVTSGNFTIKDEWDNVKNRLEVGVGLGAGVELIKHVQVGLKYFWNFGGIYQNEWSTFKIGETQCGGIALSVAVLL